ncbi:molybdopterin molybdenumtransferase MoeA [Salipiger sp. IMCC34102]|uniref:molybdenum cofactor synthesis domain-containing protein n=1 Tax=Salipiger sp. IMCC34102 TaxID=2510647 RepID=UPI00101CBFDC|nr:gephyrin-like molybdotransferase Glp [Salipiger sp. IMCC34102]RYH01640.1 molybdopterin molybdenumtransferase MoeA [Salipiger sp. IMCC34102]
MSRFDSVLMVDWSGGHDRGATPKKDAIWTCLARAGHAEAPVYHRNRQVAEAAVTQILRAELDAGRRTLVGFDLCFAYPVPFAETLTGNPDPLDLWDWFEARVTDTPTANNRFALAGEINARFPGTGPFWANGRPGHDVEHLPRTKAGYGGHGIPEQRATDLACGGFSPFQLAGAGAVGGQVIMGFPTLARLRRTFGDALAVWPFEQPTRPITLVETYFSLLPASNLPDHAVKDAAQVALYAMRFSALSKGDWDILLDHPADAEGRVLGADHVGLLEPSAQIPQAPPLRNDCFAMPQGAHWTPVDEALAHLRAELSPVVGTETLPLSQATGRILARPVTATRSHPPHPNSAVDGYALAGPLPEGAHSLPLAPGRAAAGVPFDGTVPPGHALRILTGANIPAGTDTVVLQEDVAATDTHIALNGPLKRGANARRAGEDMVAGSPVLPGGRRLTPADLATLAACGTATVTVHSPLRVGVLSTGDELRDPGTPATDGEIFDANRPMLLDDVARWGHIPVDLGRAPDDRETLRAILSDAATKCDAILTSGGASAGDEDHVSALLSDTGSFALWRIAVKPGRPLALGLWDETPVFGLPGNPVAAQVCALIFARPALARLAGADWSAPQAFTVPAAFTKSKKPGRREYLRARLTDGAAEVFASEGSGRVSGLSWATGLVELPDHACDVVPGTLVRYLPFASFLA